SPGGAGTRRWCAVLPPSPATCRARPRSARRRRRGRISDELQRVSAMGHRNVSLVNIDKLCKALSRCVLRSARDRLVENRVVSCALPAYLTPTSSTSKTSVALGGILGGCPSSP